MKILIQDYSIKDVLQMMMSILSTITTPSKIINFIKTKYSAIMKTGKSLGYPLNVLIEPTRNCNYQCPQCPRQEYPEIKNLKKMELTIKDFKMIMDQLGKYLLTIRFWHFGEPLLNKDLPEMISLAKKNKIFTVISSNCSLLYKDFCKKLIESKLDYLLISMNAATNKTYKKFTATENFDIVVKNLKQLVELKKELKSRVPFINLQYIVMKENYNEIQKIKEIAKYIGVDKLSFKYPGFKRDEFGIEDSKFQLKDLDKIIFVYYHLKRELYPLMVMLRLVLLM